MSADGASVIITGGAGDLAREMAACFRKAGYEVASPGRAELDVTAADAPQRYFEGREPELLICNAGITRDQPLVKLKEKDWDAVMQVNLRGVLNCVRPAIEAMKAKQGGGGGHIVLISSHSAIHPPIGQAAYATAKAALIGLVTDLAQAHGADNIRVNAVLPGFLETKMTAKVSEARKQQVIAEQALGRLNTCEQVASFIRALHEDLVHTSGQVFHLDSRRYCY
ncbi:MAG: SDR family oxidoreductase [Akkermansiaceae bacterium]|nr:SDR family oxidoreductase [Akkermansiaceae bacterium]